MLLFLQLQIQPPYRRTPLTGEKGYYLLDKHVAVTTLLPPMVRSVLRFCHIVYILPPHMLGSGGEDLAEGETNLKIGAAPRSRREGPPPTTATAVATAAPYCRAACHP
jgi:hypothetical protein